MAPSDLPPTRGSIPVPWSWPWGMGSGWTRRAPAPTAFARHRELPSRQWWPPWPGGWPSAGWHWAISGPASRWRRPTWPSPALPAPLMLRRIPGSTGGGANGPDDGASADATAPRSTPGRSHHDLHQRGDPLSDLSLIHISEPTRPY